MIESQTHMSFILGPEKLAMTTTKPRNRHRCRGFATRCGLVVSSHLLIDTSAETSGSGTAFARLLSHALDDGDKTLRTA